MGDCGSLTVGFFLATVPLLFDNPENNGKMIIVAIAIAFITISNQITGTLLIIIHSILFSFLHFREKSRSD